MDVYRGYCLQAHQQLVVECKLISRGLLTTAQSELKVSVRMVWPSNRARNLLNSGLPSNGPLITDFGYSSSEQESSEGEFVETEKPWPPVDLARASRSRTKIEAVHVPRPHSHLFRKADGRARGSKHSRRWENCKRSWCVGVIKGAEQWVVFSLIYYIDVVNIPASSLSQQCS